MTPDEFQATSSGTLCCREPGRISEDPRFAKFGSSKTPPAKLSSATWNTSPTPPANSCLTPSSKSPATQRLGQHPEQTQDRCRRRRTSLTRNLRATALLRSVPSERSEETPASLYQRSEATSIHYPKFPLHPQAKSSTRTDSNEHEPHDRPIYLLLLVVSSGCGRFVSL